MYNHLAGFMQSPSSPVVETPDHWWQFDGDALDTGSAAILYDGAATNVTYGAGKGGNQCAIFAGNGYVNVGNLSSMMSLSSDGTIAYWGLVSVNTASFFFAHYEGNYRFYEGASPTAATYLQYLGMGGGFVTSSSGNIIGVWYHFATTWDGSTAIPYLNGVAGTPYNYSFTTSANDLFYLGALNSSDSRKLQGKMQDVRLYKSKKSEAEIEAIKNILA